jgi:hypothetical protein
MARDVGSWTIGIALLPRCADLLVEVGERKILPVINIVA